MPHVETYETAEWGQKRPIGGVKIERYQKKQKILFLVCFIIFIIYFYSFLIFLNFDSSEVRFVALFGHFSRSHSILGLGHFVRSQSMQEKQI